MSSFQLFLNFSWFGAVTYWNLMMTKKTGPFLREMCHSTKWFHCPNPAVRNRLVYMRRAWCEVVVVVLGTVNKFFRCHKHFFLTIPCTSGYIMKIALLSWDCSGLTFDRAFWRYHVGRRYWFGKQMTGRMLNCEMYGGKICLDSSVP